MFGELEYTERDGHANFVLYLQATTCGIELPIVGLLTLEKVLNYTMQIVTVVRTGMAVALAILQGKT